MQITRLRSAERRNAVSPSVLVRCARELEIYIPELWLRGDGRVERDFCDCGPQVALELKGGVARHNEELVVLNNEHRLDDVALRFGAALVKRNLHTELAPLLRRQETVFVLAGVAAARVYHPVKVLVQLDVHLYVKGNFCHMQIER